MADMEGKLIPATQRPDGTWRKARRVKQGYVPQEEVPLYESKGKQFANRKSNLSVVPGMCPTIADAEKKERERQQRLKIKQQNQANGKSIPKGVIVLPKNSLTINPTTVSSAHGAKSSIARTSPKSISCNLSNTSTNSTAPRLDVDAVINDLNALQLSNDDFAKKLKKLRKKIREIETIEAKIKSGELKKPEKDQLDKIKRKKEILNEIKITEEQIYRKIDQKNNSSQASKVLPYPQLDVEFCDNFYDSCAII